MDELERLRADILNKVDEYYRLSREQQPGTHARKINYAGRVFDAEEMRNLTSAALEFWLTAGHWYHEFEHNMAEFLHTKEFLMVNSGSSANLLAFMTLTQNELGERRIKRGDEVIGVAAAFPTTVAPIVQFGAIPVFVDVLPNGNIDPDKLELALSPKTKAVFIAHALGNPFNLDKVGEFCRRNNLWLIEDNCDALGSSYRGKMTGTFGDLATFSFYPPHHITTGEGGGVATGNPELARIARSMRDWGRDCVCPPGIDNKCGHRFDGQFGTLPRGYDHKYVYSHLGYNLKATDMQAAIGCAQLKKLPNFIRKRRENFNFLKHELAELEHFFLLPDAEPHSDPAWFGFMMQVKPDAPFSRNEIVRHLEDNRIQTRNLFAGNLTRHPCWGGDFNFRIAGELIETDRIMNSSFWIGVYPGLSGDDLHFMADTIKDFCRKFR